MVVTFLKTGINLPICFKCCVTGENTLLHIPLRLRRGITLIIQNRSYKFTGAHGFGVKLQRGMSSDRKSFREQPTPSSAAGVNAGRMRRKTDGSSKKCTARKFKHVSEEVLNQVKSYRKIRCQLYGCRPHSRKFLNRKARQIDKTCVIYIHYKFYEGRTAIFYI